MDNYKFTDGDNDSLEIEHYLPEGSSLNEPHAYVVVSGSGVNIRRSEAPKVALKLLELAGWEPNPWAMEGVPFAMSRLEDHVKKQEQEALLATLDDAEVDRYRRHTLARQGVVGPTDWADEDGIAQNLWRSEYLAAKEYFENPKAKPEPATLEFGADEPDRSTRWTSDYIQPPAGKDVAGNPQPLQYDADRGGWTWGTCAATMSWHNLGQRMFPLTQVSE